MTRHKTEPDERASRLDPLVGRSKDPRDEAVVELLMGLNTDGAHHKQYYLERAFRALCEDGYVDEAKEKFGWLDGTPA